MKTSGMHKSESRVDVATLPDNDPNQVVANAVGKQLFLPRSGRSGIVESASMIPFASPLLPIPCRGRYPPCRLCTTRKNATWLSLCVFTERSSVTSVLPTPTQLSSKYHRPELLATWDQEPDGVASLHTAPRISPRCSVSRCPEVNQPLACPLPQEHHFSRLHWCFT